MEYVVYKDKLYTVIERFKDGRVKIMRINSTDCITVQAKELKTIIRPNTRYLH